MTRLSLEEIFSPTGPISKAVGEKYHYREKQVEASFLIDSAIEEGTPVLLEAGTGIGKSYAYLVPVVLSLIGNNKKAVIATSTNTLLTQLYKKDIPSILDALGVKLNTASLYGKSNYLCLRLWKEYSSDMLRCASDDVKEFSLWVNETESGLLSDESPSLREIDKARLTSDEDNCPGRKCPFFMNCFYYKARRKAEDASIIATNHHIVLTDALIRKENDDSFKKNTYLLPPYSYLVLDEAHKLEKETIDILSNTYSTEGLKGLLNKISGKNGKLSLLDMVKRENPDFDVSAVNALIKAIIETSFTLGKEFSETTSIMGLKAKNSEEQLGPLDNLFFERFSSHFESLNPLINLIDKLIAIIDLKAVNEDGEYTALIHNYSASLFSLRNVLENFLSSLINGEEKNIVLYMTVKDGAFQSLVFSPVFVSGELEDLLFYEDGLDSIVFSSATLSVGESNCSGLEYFRKSIGLKKEREIKCGIYPSPFDLRKNAMLIVPREAPTQVYQKENESILVFSEIIAKSIRSSRGGALVLFSSIDRMNKVYSLVKDRIGDSFPLYLQKRKDTRDKILDSFKKDRNSCLFATSSFWEGIDVPGDSLRLLIIDKIPFASPSDPLEKGRKRSREDYFRKYSLPEALLKLKQGVGRLIRNENDRGVVLLLDGRLNTSYKAELKKLLPAWNIRFNETDIDDKIKAFFGEN